MRRLGWVEGHNLAVERRLTREDTEDRKTAAAELVAENLDVIVAAGIVDALPVHALTRTIPIVVIDGVDLVRPGLPSACRARAAMHLPGSSTANALSYCTSWCQRRHDIRLEMVPLSGHMRWFRRPYPIQQTWKYPIALYLDLVNGKRPTLEDIREHQRSALGDSDLKQTTAIELMPLPSNKADELTWLYGDYASIGLRTRKQYLQTYKPERIQKLAVLIETYKPNLVIFYGVGLLDDWRATAGIQLSTITRQMYFGENCYTSFCAIPQTQSRGMSFDRLFEYADLIRERVAIAPPRLRGASNLPNHEPTRRGGDWLLSKQKGDIMNQIATRVHAELTDIIRLLAEENPKQPRSKSWKRYALYRNGMSIGNYVDAVKKQYGGYEPRVGFCLLTRTS
jgi:hypothetical protein